MTGNLGPVWWQCLNKYRTGAMTQSPAAFPPLPAETTGLAGAVIWLVQMMLWTVARAAPGTVTAGTATGGTATAGMSEVNDGIAPGDGIASAGIWAWKTAWEGIAPPEGGPTMASQRSWLRLAWKMIRDMWLLREAGPVRVIPPRPRAQAGRSRSPSAHPFATAGPWRKFGGGTSAHWFGQLIAITKRYAWQPGGPRRHAPSAGPAITKPMAANAVRTAPVPSTARNRITGGRSRRPE